MRKSIMRATVFMIITVVLVACGGGGGGGSDAIDSITIDSLTPSIVSAGTPTTFTITVSYGLQTKERGVIRYGFKPDGISSYILETDEKIVSKGTGTALFIAEKTLDEPTTLRVQLAEYPTPPQYSPLVSAHQTITVNP